MISFLKPSPAVPPLPPEKIDPEYRRLRRQVFAGIFIGYAAFYLVRKNFALAIPDILRDYPQYSKAALGSITSVSLTTRWPSTCCASMLSSIVVSEMML